MRRPRDEARRGGPEPGLNFRELADAAFFAESRLGFRPDAMQARVLDLSIRRGLLNCSRQWGKSTVTALKALHFGLAQPASHVLMVSATWSQVTEFLQKAKDFLAVLGIPARGDGVNRRSIGLPNGSRIVATSGRAHVRGFSRVSLLLVDEAAEVPDATYLSLRPMLAAVEEGDASLWLMSTPAGRWGFFYETWAHGGPRWTRIMVPATECPRISAAYLEEEREAMGDRWFRQEYLCEFLETRGGLFRVEDIEQALSDETPALWGGVEAPW